MRDNFQESIQQLTQAAQDRAVERIRAGARADDGGRMLAVGDVAREWVALLLLSRKAETRATGEYRYCAGDFDLGNGTAWRWHYSLSNENRGPVLRILNAQVVPSDAVEDSAPEDGVALAAAGQ